MVARLLCMMPADTKYAVSVAWHEHRTWWKRWKIGLARLSCEFCLVAWLVSCLGPRSDYLGWRWSMAVRWPHGGYWRYQRSLSAVCARWMALWWDLGGAGDLDAGERPMFCSSYTLYVWACGDVHVRVAGVYDCWSVTIWLAGVTSSLKVGRQSRLLRFGGAFEHGVSSSEMKTQDLTCSDCTWQWWCSTPYPCCRHCLEFARTYSQGKKKSKIYPPWVNLVTTTLVRRTLLGGIVVETLFTKFGWCHLVVVDVDGCCISEFASTWLWFSYSKYNISISFWTLN